MNKPSQPNTTSGLATLLRPRFSPGLLLEDEDLNAAVDYTRNMSRLLFRSLFGCGVICGLKVQAWLTCNGKKVKVTVGKGVGLDCMGNPIEVPSDQTLIYDAECKTLPPYIWVTVCYIEKCCRPRDIGCNSDDDRGTVQTRSLDGYEIHLLETRPKCACTCEPVSSKADDPRKDCCAKQKPETPPEVVEEGAAGADWCACYKDHYEGVCACECECNCIVVGRIATTPSQPLASSEPAKDVVLDKVGVGVRRLIRPMLISREACPKPKAAADGAAKTTSGGEAGKDSQSANNAGDDGQSDIK